MKFLFCGSGASEGIPALFCSCEICGKARSRGGKEMRSRTAYQFGESVRIDFGPDLFGQQNRYGLRLDRLEHLFITHSHKDHFTPLNFIYRRPQYVPLEKTLYLHAGEDIIEQTEKVLKENGSDFAECLITPVESVFFRSEEIDAEGEKMTVTPLPSDHLPAGKTRIYEIAYREKRVLVGTDSGIYPNETWNYFKGRHYDLAVMDATSGILGLRQVHMGRECLVETVKRLRQMGVYDDCTLVIANHFSHNGKMNHDDLEAYYGPRNIHVGFDGLEIDFSGHGRLVL
ncbi:MAG: putative hydrolase [Lentisphaerae bacterium ADurb.Bin242]|nr:MAG: putative hydrolase [Lentisphaerae bacterium ADurb.Bin242]